MYRIESNNKYEKALSYLKGLNKIKYSNILDKYGEIGVRALMDATPIDTGKTRASWYYRINEQDGRLCLQFCNSNVSDYVVVAVILQYGHATGTGGWVEGTDYINPAIAPVFDQMVNDIWEEINSR